jgi:acetyltransferase
MVSNATSASYDPAYSILRAETEPLRAIFAPRSMAIIGASETPGSVGQTLLRNAIASPFGGTVYPVNPKRESVLGIEAYPSIGAIGKPIDLALIATPARTVPSVIRECAAVGVKGAIVISAGFKEVGAAGVALEQEVLAEARKGHMRLIGPNCLGVMNPHLGLNATFASTIANPGNVGFISQSGALCTSILDWSFRENVGFSAFVSIGSMLDVNWGDLIYYLGDDPNTDSIVIYMESIGDARSFLSAAREVALTKPIVVIKAGRTEAAAKAATSHTGALTGSDDVLDAAFERCGVLRVNTIDDLFNMAEILAKQPRPKGRKLTILTNAGGPGVLATDALTRDGGELAPLSDRVLNDLNACLPPHWSHGNPIDILGDADPARYAASVAAAADNPDSDGLLVILTPQSMTDPTAIAQELTRYADSKKPLLASWMGGEVVAEGEAILNQANIFTFPYPDTATHVFNLMWRYSESLTGLYETPRMLPEGQVKRELVSQTIAAIRNSGRTLLTEFEAKLVLAAYDIPTVETRIATSEDEAVAAADEIGYPIAIKIYSEVITHKTDVGGVKLDLPNGDAVREAYREIAASVREKFGEDNFAKNFEGVTVQPMLDLSDGYELIVGSSIDPQFGPVLLFGTGGQLVEVFEDRAIALPPLNTTLAQRTIEKTRIYKALQGVRGRAAIDIEGLQQILVRFSQLTLEHRAIKEIDINPLLVKPVNSGAQTIVALDARIVLHDPDMPHKALPKPAIRPYPMKYVAPWTTKDGYEVTIRPISPEDEPLIADFHKTLSEESVYQRFFHMMKLSQRVLHSRLTRICFIDYDREMALVAEGHNPETGEREIWGVSRLTKLHGIDVAEFGLLISDHAQGKGLGGELLSRIVQVGRDEGLESIEADILAQNRAMQHVAEKVGFTIERSSADTVKARIVL